MASWTAGAGTRATLVHTVDVNSQNAATNQSSLHVNTYVNVFGTSGITDNAGDANWNVNTAGSGSRSSNFNYSWGNGDHGLDTYDITVNHDVNGNCTIGVHAFVDGRNSPFFVSASIDTSLGIPRLALAPAILAIIADTITPTSARLGGELSSYGHGTTANMNMYYRLQGSGTWIDLGNQGDAAGYNYWSVTGLQPGKTYEYMMNAWNNNGDGASSSTQTFKTKSASGMITVMQAIL